MRVQIDTDRRPDLPQVAAEVQSALGLNEPPSVVGRDPGQTDNDGNPLPGMVAVDVPDDSGFTADDLDTIVGRLPPRPDPTTQRRADLDAVKAAQGWTPQVRDALVRLLGG